MRCVYSVCESVCVFVCVFFLCVGGRWVLSGSEEESTFI